METTVYGLLLALLSALLFGARGVRQSDRFIVYRVRFARKSAASFACGRPAWSVTMSVSAA